MSDNISVIIANAKVVDKTNLAKNIKPVIKDLCEALENNKMSFKQANLIDEKNKNGFILDFDVISHILNSIQNETLIYGDITSSNKNDEKKYKCVKKIMDSGTIVYLNDGNTYAIIEMVLKNIMAGNSLIIANDGYMYGTNKLLIEIVNNVLEEYNISNHLVQLYTYENINDIFLNYANIDLIVCTGDHNFQQLVLNKSKNKVITSGYENFDLYIEDTKNINLINKIVNSKLNINIYIKEELYLDYPNSIRVADIDEAIASINYTGSGYSAAIFTESNENANRFLDEVHASMIMINTSPLIERIIDLKVTDLTTEKTIIYPNDYKFLTSGIKITPDK